MILKALSVLVDVWLAVIGGLSLWLIVSGVLGDRQEAKLERRRQESADRWETAREKRYVIQSSQPRLWEQD